MTIPPSDTPSKSRFPRIIIVVLGLFGVCMLASIAVIVVLALLGPAIGTVFSNIITNLPTPTPY